MNVDKKLIQEAIDALKLAEAIDFPIVPDQVGVAQAHCMMARAALQSAIKWHESASIAARNWKAAQAEDAAADFISTLE